MSDPSSSWTYDPERQNFRDAMLPEQVHNFQQDPNPPLFKPPPALHLRPLGRPPPRPDELDHELFPVTTQDDIGLDILPKLARIGVSLNSYDIDFTLECEIIRFIRQEKEMGRPIESAITITGPTNRALATTCEEYMNWQWPKTGTRLLKCLAHAEATNNGPLYTDSHTNIQDTIGLVTVSICVERSNRIKVTLSGPKEELHELSEQLAWLTASLRICPESTAMLSSIEFGVIGTDPAESKRLGYRIATSDLNDLSASSGHFDMCWLPLFKNTPIAQGFDVPAREDQQGLELSFEDLVTLAGIDCPLDRNGKLIFVGISTILIPMKINEDGSVQWHLSVSDASDRLQQYDKNHEIKSVLPSTLIDPFHQSHTSTDLLIQRLSETRHFLGWTKKVRVLLGTDEGQYDSAAWTKTKEERTTKHISSRNISIATSFSIGPSGKGTMGINFGRTYDNRDNRNPRIPFSNKDDRFEEVLDNRKDELILLYDPLEQRAWMVPLLSVLLHMTIIRIKRDGYEKNGDKAQGVTLPYAQAGWDGSEEARKALRKYRFLELGQQDSKKPYRLQELATNLIYAIQNTYPQYSSRRFQKQNLFGYEFMDIVTMEPPFRLKKSSLSMPNGGWKDFARDVQVVLFCCGIGDALVPDQDVTHPCVSWQTVPKHMNYLGAAVKGLKHLAARTGHRESCQYLLEGYMWRCPSNSFDYTQCCQQSNIRTDCQDI